MPKKKQLIFCTGKEEPNLRIFKRVKRNPKLYLIIFERVKRNPKLHLIIFERVKRNPKLM